MRRVEEALGTRERQLDRRSGDLERRAGEVKRREDEIDQAEEEVEQLRSTMLRAELPHDDDSDVEYDDDGSPVQAWLDRRRRKQASLEARQADLDRREDSMRELESRLRSMEGTLARKEADLTAFAEMLPAVAAHRRGGRDRRAQPLEAAGRRGPDAAPALLDARLGRRPALAGSAGAGGASGSAGSEPTCARRLSSTSRSAIWTLPATGIASSAPSTPSSDEPISTASSTVKPDTFTERRITSGCSTLFSTCW